MRITPLDVRKQEFRRAVRGFDTDEVHAFLATVADEYEVALTDNKNLRERVMELDEKVAEYRNMERTLRDTLITAERVMSEARQNARKEAELILRDAQLKANQETSGIAKRVDAMKSQLRDLRAHRDTFLARLQSLSETQLGLVENFRDDFDNEDHRADALMDEDFSGDTQEVVETKKKASDDAPVAPKASGPSAPACAAPAEDQWRNYSVGGEGKAPEPVDASSDGVSEAVEMLEESSAEWPEPASSGQSDHAVATYPDVAPQDPAESGSADASDTSESFDSELETVPGENEGDSSSGWSLSRFTKGLGKS